MQDVLFNTDRPTKDQQPAEFYELSLEAELQNGKEIFVLREKHGWWNGEQRSMVVDEGDKHKTVFNSYRDGLRAYVERMNLHVRRAFIHSFIWHPVSGEPSYNQKLEKR